MASTGGLHGDIGLSAYAASKGGLLAFGRSLAAEGAGRGVLTNLLLPYALASEECRLNGEYIVTGAGRLRRASVVEWDTVWLPNEPDLSPGQLEALLARSHAGEPREYRVAADAFADLMEGG